MSEFTLVFIGILCALLIVLIIYPSQFYFRIYFNKNKIKNTFMQIKGQVDIKDNLIKEYLNNYYKKEYEDVLSKIDSYASFSDFDIEILKEFNEFFDALTLKLNNKELIEQVKIANEKINYIKEYYNELVSDFNNYKNAFFNVFFTKIVAIKDENYY